MGDGSFVASFFFFFKEKAACVVDRVHDHVSSLVYEDSYAHDHAIGCDLLIRKFQES